MRERKTMVKRSAALLGGVIRVKIKALYPERVLNVLSARSIMFWDPVLESEAELSLSLRRGDYRQFLAALEKLEAEATVEQREGAPYFLRRFRRRYSLLCGLGALLVLVACNALFIWDFEVSGAETVSSAQILRALEDAGLRRGSFAYNIRPQELCNRVLPQFPELAWLTVNVRGCRAYVEVRERIPKPEIVTETVPSNVIAAKDALVTQVRALDGEALVMKDMMVLKGQLLISGAVNTKGPTNPSVGTRFLAGRGEVWGRTWYNLAVRIPLTYDAKIATGEKDHVLSVCFGRKRVKFGAKDSSNSAAMCDKIKKQIPLTLPGGFALPFSLELETLSYYETEPSLRERTEAEQRGKELLGAYLRSQIDGEVTRERYSSAVEGDWLLVTLSAECHEQIGQVVPIPMEK